MIFSLFFLNVNSEQTQEISQQLFYFSVISACFLSLKSLVQWLVIKVIIGPHSPPTHSQYISDCIAYIRAQGISSCIAVAHI